MAQDELTDRSEKFLAGETVREKLFRFTGDELPYTSTVVVDKFEEEPSPKHKRMVKIAATIVVERDGHKAMVIGDKGERLKRIGTEARQELEKLMDCQGVPGDLGQGALRLGRRRSAGAQLRLRVMPAKARLRSGHGDQAHLATSPPSSCTATTGANPA